MAGSNSELRRRKVKEHNGRTTQKKKQKENETKMMVNSFLCLVICSLLLILLAVLYTDNIPWHIGHKVTDNIAKFMGVQKAVYAVVVDAGSTGSRVLAFEFHKAYLDDHLVLDNELFVYTKPGLSSFADNPEKAVESVSGLLNKAKAFIPEQHWASTPLILRATAGLRLLPSKKAEGLLAAMRKLFKEMPFLTDDESVQILDGTDEGIYSWFTVNFLLDLAQNPAKSVAALDLGGGSTQVTFSALTPSTLKEKDYIHDAVLPYGKTPVYTNSYLGLGLMAVRKEVLTHNYTDPKMTTIYSDCVNPIIKNKKFHYAGTDYYVNGLQDNYPILQKPKQGLAIKNDVPIVDYKACAEIVRKYVRSKAKPPEELSNKKIFAFSYYFDRATESGLISESTGGSITVEDFQRTAQEVCNEANADQPFMCLDLTIISVLLEDGLGLDKSTKVFLFKKINGHEISWALGAAFNKIKSRT